MSELDAPQDHAALRALLLRSERAGAARRAVMLHTDRLPPALSRPHHLRLAREALSGIARAERAQVFELTLGRVAIVWRASGGGEEVAEARLALEHLLAGQPGGQSTGAGQLLTLYDLPEQASWLLDEIAQAEPPAAAPPSLQPLDAHRLARLEAGLAQADLSRFTRWRPVMRLGHTPEVAWEERHFAVHEIAASLCPEVAIKADPWLFARLTRTLDRRMLSLLTAPSGLRGCGRFAIHLNVETMVSQDFLRFDEALPLALRGEVILNIAAPDLLADPERFAFASRFARARLYRLALSRATPRLLGLLDLRRLGLDYVHLAHTPELALTSAAVAQLVPAGTQLVANGLDSASRLEWATRSGFALGCGAALAG